MAFVNRPTTSSPKVPLLNVVADNAPQRDAIVEALTEVVDSGRFLFGPDVAQLENEIAALSQADNAVACASGSDALLLSLMALGIGPGDEVIVPSFTFFATVSCVTRLGATPVFVDIRKDTFNVDPERIADAITPKTRAIIPVHLFGQCAEMDVIVQMACEKDIVVVEDAAQAIGAAYHSRPAGAWGLTGCFSFYPTKNLGAMGDAGMITTLDAATANRLRLFAGHGMRPRYYHQVVGINSRMDSFQAAVLRIKLQRLSDAVESRSRIADRYDRLIADAGLVGDDAITLPHRDPAAHHVWNQYSLRIAGGRRDDLRNHLGECGVASEIYYPIPVHRQECYRDLDPPKDPLVETDRAAAEILHLPIFPSLDEASQCRVVESLTEFYARGKVASAA